MPNLPVPDGEGIYSFADDLETAHRHWMASLASAASTEPVMEVKAPATGERYLIEERRPAGCPVVVIEPHHDDFVLSASGRFLAHPRPLIVITVFTRSRSVHPSLEAAYPTVEAVSSVREEEAAVALRPFGASRILLGHRDASPPYRPFDGQRAQAITAELRTILADHPGAELLAPAGVTRHPDHLLVHEAARALGCRWFWEDVAFWPTYALAGCDRVLFEQRTAKALVPELTDITDVVLDKLTLLRLHGSQMHPPRKMYRPLRHAWTIAADLLDRPPTGAAQYAERFYRLEDSA
ncbi:PIG-L deacetylase family protein [Streptomyces xanthochromogenes]|uniref:PIG-L deacetylase family protein n=1 Tax=Streptomyces xanthochromogenes TaxID=67384 RepID=UPI0038105ABE